MNVIVLIADIVKSKEISDRKYFQTDLKSELEEINKSSKWIISPYTITLGDEFQAVYKNSENLLKDILRILIKVYPVRIRFSIGCGNISTEINIKESIGMDGPAFYIARDGINEMKKIDYSIIQFYRNTIKENELVNKSLKLSMSVMADWKKNTLLIFNELVNSKPVKEIAPILNITERGIYKIVDTQKLRNFTDYFLYLETEIKKLKDGK